MTPRAKPLVACLLTAFLVAPGVGLSPARAADDGWEGSSAGRKYLAYPLGLLDGDCIQAQGEDFARITRVTQGGPLDKAGLQKGDEIIGFAFDGDMIRLPVNKGNHETMRALGEAIDEAGARPDRTLKLMVRAGRREGWMRAILAPTPRFGKNYPYNCPKSMGMFHACCDWMIAHLGAGSPSAQSAWMGLALMCSPDPRHQAHVHKIAQAFEARLRANPDVGHNAHMGWTMVFLAEYSWRYAKSDPTGFMRRKAILEAMSRVLVARQGRANNKGHECAPGYDGVFFHGGGDRCYGGTGQNLATTAAFMGWCAAAKLNGAQVDQGAWNLTYTFLTRKCMGGNDQSGYGIGYSAGGPDGQGSARTAQLGHALLDMGLPELLPAAKFPPLKYAQKDMLRYGSGMGTWCLGNSPSTPESHAVGSFPMIAATALIWRTGGLKSYREHMDRWKWYLSLSMQPDGHARYVPGDIGPAGDSYLGEETVANCVAAMMLAAPTRKLVMFGALDAKGPGPDNPYHLGGAGPAPAGDYKIGDGYVADPVGIADIDKRIASLQGCYKSALRGEFSETLQRLDEIKTKKISEADAAAADKLVAYIYTQGIDPQIKSIEESLAAGDPLSAYRRFNLFKPDFPYVGERKAKVASLAAQFQNPATTAMMDAGRDYEKVLLIYQAQPEEHRAQMEAFAKAHPNDFYGASAKEALAIQAKNGAPVAAAAAAAVGGDPELNGSPVTEEDE